MLIAASMSGAKSADIACLTKIGQDEENFLTPFKDLVVDKTLLTKGPELQDFIDSNKAKFYALIAGNVLSHCILPPNYSDFNKIADASSIVIPFEIDTQKYDITVDTTYLFDHIELPTAILVFNNRTKSPGDVIKKSEMPKDYFFSSDCSDHYIKFNLSDDACVNVAGQSAFAAYGGSDNEYFLDMPVGKSCRAFPGLVLGDFGGWGAEEKVIAYNNYQEGRKAMKAFASRLQNTACGNQGLAVYQVSINNMPVEQNGKEGFAIAAGVVGAPMAYLGITAGLYALGVGVGSYSAASMAIFSGALASSSVPVAGWIVAGVLTVAGTVAAFWPYDLADVPQVVVLSDPEIIR